MSRVSLNWTQFRFPASLLCCGESSYLPCPSVSRHQAGQSSAVGFLCAGSPQLLSLLVWVLWMCHSRAGTAALLGWGDSTGTSSAAGRFLSRVYCSLENHCVLCSCWLEAEPSLTGVAGRRAVGYKCLFISVPFELLCSTLIWKLL